MVEKKEEDTIYDIEKNMINYLTILMRV